MTTEDQTWSPPYPGAFLDLTFSDEHYADLSGDPTMTRARWEAERPEREAEDSAWAIHRLREALIADGCPAPYVDVVVLPALLRTFKVVDRESRGVLQGDILVSDFTAREGRRLYRSLMLVSGWEPVE